MTNLGRLLKLHRTSTGSTIDQTAADIGIERSALHRLETGRTAAPDKVLAVCAWLLRTEDAQTGAPKRAPR